jgi:pimeloyl-ACP methyl ester carboxylesterase
MKKILLPLGFILVLLALTGCSAVQRKFLFHPTHHHRDNGLTPWLHNGKIIGYSRSATTPKNVWLMLHGNGGQAADRAYAIPAFSAEDSVYIMEYPGYGVRDGVPSTAAFDAAAAEAYGVLRNTFPTTPVCVVGESIGTGPASTLAGQAHPPDKIVLVVPFDNLKSVAADHFPFLPVGLILGESWDNVQALSHYKGPIEIFGAKEDTIIPIKHAEQLSRGLPSAKFHRIPGGHNEWWTGERVEIANP